MEKQSTVNTFICSLFLFYWTSTNKPKCPPLELIGV